MYSVTRRSLHEGRLPTLSRAGTAHPALGASTVAARMGPAAAAFGACVVVMAISFRLKTSVMVGLEVEARVVSRRGRVYPTLVGIGYDSTLVGTGSYRSRH